MYYFGWEGSDRRKGEGEGRKVEGGEDRRRMEVKRGKVKREDMREGRRGNGGEKRQRKEGSEGNGKAKRS